VREEEDVPDFHHQELPVADNNVADEEDEAALE